jgi:hypothetical protein
MSTSEVCLETANRNTANVASLKGRARWGLQERIRRRLLSRKVGEREAGAGAVVGTVLLELALARMGEADVVCKELGEVEVVVVAASREEGRRRVVTSQMIVFKMAGVGGSEKPAFIDIATCRSGCRHVDTIQS